MVEVIKETLLLIVLIIGSAFVLIQIVDKSLDIKLKMLKLERLENDAQKEKGTKEGEESSSLHAVSIISHHYELGNHSIYYFNHHLDYLQYHQF